MASHPALEHILKRIRSEADAFESAWTQAAAPREDRGPLRPVRSSMRLLRRTLAAAAVVALLVVGRQWISPEPTADLPSWAAAASWDVASLPDGSEVRIAPGTTLTWLSEEGDGERRVRLEGSAFFDVTAGPDPFRVETGEALTTVLGTSFGVRTEGGTEVTLVSGRVSLARLDGQALILEPGQQGWMTEGMTLPEIRTVELGEALSWTELLIFRDTPMAEVARQLSQAFDVTITLHDSLKETPLTGTFESERGTKAILDIIGAALGATVTVVEAGRFELNPAPRN
jgi:transmembrane sensor